MRSLASLLAPLAALVALMGALPPPTQAARCGGRPIVERNAAVELRADRLVTFGGMTCRTARVTVRRFLRRQLSSFRGCAVPAANGGACRVADYRCEKVGRASCRHRLFARGVRFRERDVPTG